MSEAAAHSKWSASGFEQRMLCPGSHVLQADKPNSSSKYAAEGTAAHQVLTWALQETRPATAYLGRVITVNEAGRVTPEVTPGGDNRIAYTFEVDDDMARHVQTCVDYVTDLAGDDGAVFADIRVNYSSYLDVPESEAWGTADVIVARGDEIIVIDFKYGMGVEVSAERNPQMSLYALGALQAYNGLVADFTRVRMAISQPRIKAAPSEFDLSVDELEAWGRSTARSAVNSCRNASSTYAGASDGATTPWLDTFLRPGEKQCKFCRAKATCPALRAEVSQEVFNNTAASPDAFGTESAADPKHASEAEWLAACLAKVDLIEDWCKAIRAETERRLLAGDNVPGFKLVQGKRGARQWADAKAAEETLKAMRLKEAEMYDFSVKSPTQIAKLGPKFDKQGKVVPPKEGEQKPVIGPKQWNKVQALIVQKEGAPHVAPVSDSRPALVMTPVADDFENLA